MKQYSISEANSNLAGVILEAERHPIAITRRGEAVAVVLSVDAYKRMQASRRPDLAAAIADWRAENDVASLGIDPDAIWGVVRDRSSGREVDLG
jgi:prevent-host-death family protein